MTRNEGQPIKVEGGNPGRQEGSARMRVEGESPGREALLQRAAGLLPGIRERASRAEELRRVPPETVEDLKASGLLRIPNPPRYGGYPHDIDLMFEVAMTLGRACGSTGWCYSVWSIHNWMLGHWPEQAQDEYYADGPDVLSSSAFAPSGKLEPVEGGFRLSGRWEFSSGCDAATWAMVGAMGPDGPRMCLLPRPDYQIVDTWFVSGLRGTGSKDLVVDGAFVPAHRLCALMGDLQGSTAYGLHNRASYRLPPMSLLPFTLCSPLVGMAEGAIEEFTRRLRGRSGPGRTADSVALQLRIAESAAEAGAARLLVMTTTRSLIEGASHGELPSELQLATVRRDYGYVTKLCVRAVNRLFEAAGGHALYDTEAMQRYHRDVNAGSHQHALDWDAIAEGYGRAVLGLPPGGAAG